MNLKLFTLGNPKTAKGEARNYLTAVLHLAPSTLSGYQVCPKATAGCIASCLNTAGRGGIFKKGETSNTIQRARIRRTVAFFENRDAFMADIVADIERAIRYAGDNGLVPVFRLNGTSDIAWEKIRCVRKGVEYRNVMDAFPAVQFYDYTKVLGRHTPANYHLTFSRAESNGADTGKAIAAGINVAVVFASKALPEAWAGVRVVNGDESDLRFLDPAGVIVGLYAKGKARKDTSGFVVR